MTNTYQGRCFCGRLSFRVEGPEKYACFCHCNSCRKASGGACVAWATFDKERFELLSGKLQEYSSSPGVTWGHCGHCGTLLTYEHERREGQIDIALASFDDPSLISPRSHIWVEDKAPWVVISDALPQFPKTAG